MSGQMRLFLSVVVVMVACIEPKLVVKIDDIVGGYSKLKPRSIHIRNNLQVGGGLIIYCLLSMSFSK